MKSLSYSNTNQRNETTPNKSQENKENNMSFQKKVEFQTCIKGFSMTKISSFFKKPSVAKNSNVIEYYELENENGTTEKYPIFNEVGMNLPRGIDVTYQIGKTDDYDTDEENVIHGCKRTQHDMYNALQIDY